MEAEIERVILHFSIFTGIVLEVFSMEYQVKDDNRVDNAVHKKIRKLGLAADDTDEEDEGFLISMSYCLVAKIHSCVFAPVYPLVHGLLS